MQYSIVNLNEILKINPAFRLDAEFYKNGYLENDKFLLKFPLKNISEYSFITDGEHGSPDWDENSNIKYITAENIKPGYILRNKFRTISKNQHKRNDRSRVRENDILLYSVGGRGYVAKAENDLFPCNIPRSVAIIRLNNFNNFLPEYVTIFLNTKYGEYQVQRLQAGNIQPMLSLENIKKFQIIELSIKFQKEVSNIYNTSYSLRQSADNLYQEAENILLEELGLKDYIPQNKKCFTKNLSDTQKAGRFDAEYFQPKYEDTIEKIKEYREGYDLLKNISNIKKCIEPGSSEYKEYGISFIRVSNLNKFEINNNNQQYVSQLFYENNLEHQPKKNEILLSKDGTLGIAYCLYKEPKKMICSSGIVRLTDIKIKPLCLTLILNSILSQMQIKQKSGGALIVHWLTNDVKNLLIPLLSPSIQSIISTKIQESFVNREKSKQLLEIAKKAVEIAIEENEEKGLDYIKNNDC